jgi:DNA gyrase subunit A
MGKINKVMLENELQTSYLDYAMSVIIGRAIPEARDGLKPVQRRILYAMYMIKNFHNLPTKKSARIVGEVIGKFHPHGDIAIYDSLARMAQEFSMNHTLVEGQGNFGSIDGDPPAAMRYTEVRLAKIAEEALADMEKETVDFVPNFDNTESEPAILPSKLPNLLVNGASGIAVGVATSIPPHNLGEVCDAVVFMLKNKDCTVEQLLEIIKGPDFPTGGIAVMSQAAYMGYKLGRGQLALKARAEINEKKGTIRIIEIPYSVNKATLIKTIVQLVRDKKIIGIKDIRDESDKNGIEIVVEYKDGFQGEQVLNQLYKHTQLQITFPLINLAIVKKSLKNLTLSQMLATFIEHRREVVLRRCRHELRVATERLHIVDGLLIAIGRIDSVIRDIKASADINEARGVLMGNYSLSERQANAILEMRLGRLTHLENETLEKEKAELNGKVDYYSKVIGDPALVDGIIINETEELKKSYARPRRTAIEISDEAVEITQEDMISDYDVTVIMTNSGYVKRLSTQNYREQARGGHGIIAMNLKEGDFAKQMIGCRNKEYVMFISNTGRAYWLKAYNIPESGRYSEGKAIVNLLNVKDERIVLMLNVKDFAGSRIAFLTSRGVVKRVNGELFSRPRATGIRAISLNEGDEIVDAIIYRGGKYFLIMTKNGKAIKFPEEDVRMIGRSGIGVRGIRLKKGDAAINIISASDAGSVLTVTEKGYGKVTDVNKYRTQGRGGGGIINIKANEKTGKVTKSLFVKDETFVRLISSNGVSITIPISSIRVTGRAASGVRLMKLDSGAVIVDAALAYSKD